MTGRHVVLIGLPGSGKSTVGARVAADLHVPFIDLDTIITRRMGMPVDRIFGEFGEAHFRQLEREAAVAALDGPVAVLAPGGGWAAESGNLDDARARSLFFYLKVSPAVALDRMGQGTLRPLVAGGEGLSRMTTLLSERETHYERADAAIGNDTDDPELAAQEIIDWMRRGGYA